MNIEKLELNKPSELTQIIFTQQLKKDLTIYKMSSLQIDLVNVIFYHIRKVIAQQKLKINKEYASTYFDFNLRDFNLMLMKYNNNQYKEIIEQLDLLSDIKIVINSLGKNNEMDELIITRFIHEIRISEHNDREHKKIKLAISNTIIDRFMDVKKFFSKMFLTIQFSMKSKYSKLLYELLKDYEGIKHKQFEYKMLLDLMNVTIEKQRLWSIFNQNILKKAIKEINEKSDILVNYEPIREKPKDGRRQVTTIKFNITQQPDKQLKKLGLIETNTMTIEEEIILNKLKLKSKTKLDKFIKNGYEVKNEDAWIKKDISSNEDLYLAQIEIDDYLIDLDELDQNKKQAILSKLASYLEVMDPFVVINRSNYCIEDLSGVILTTNAIETKDILLKIQSDN